MNPGWKWIRVLAILSWVLCTPIPVHAHGGGGGDDHGSIDPETVTFEHNVNAQLPLDLSLVEETGQTVQLGQYFGSKPVILIFAYYNCTMLCNLALSDLAQNLKELKASAGDAFEVLTISFAAGETPQLASAKKAAYMEIYDRPQAANGWHFLVGDNETIGRLTETAGFHYQYDPAIQEYAHPTGVIVLSPTGRIRRYIFGIDYNATDLRLALLEANDKQPASPIDQVFLLCYHYDPVTGKYNVAINNILRVAGMGTVLALGALVLFLNKGSKKSGMFERSRSYGE
jgi:protein SCO1/2